MAIYRDEPADWKELQIRVAEIFEYIGYETAVEQKVRTVRGTDEIDVIAVDRSGEFPVIYLCECKHWSRPISQNVIHSVRTIVQNYGAHVGVVISRNGFQAGAVEAARMTNLKLYSWEEFQSTYARKWFRAAGLKIYEDFGELFDYTDTFVGAGLSKKLDSLTDKDQRLFLKLRDTHMAVGMELLGIAHDIALYPDRNLPNAPLKNYIDDLREQGDSALNEFKQILKRQVLPS